jgi:DNA-binding NarL/FixJ family response regulator
MDKIRVLLADDHAVLRAGLRLLLNSQDDMEVVGEVATGAQAVAQARQLHPDIVLLDITMSGADGLEAVHAIKEDNPDTKVLALTMHDDESYLRHVLEAGGAGYVLKRSADTELLSAIRVVHQGGTFLHPEHAKALLEPTVEAEESEEKGTDSYDLLSDREQQVLKLLALGHTNKQIAEKLFISVKTVETYRARVREKLGLRGRAALVRYALQRGLLAGEEK